MNLFNSMLKKQNSNVNGLGPYIFYYKNYNSLVLFEPKTKNGTFQTTPLLIYPLPKGSICFD
jgi:hypothetical protein